MEEFLAAEYFGLGAGAWIGIGAGAAVLLILVMVLLTRVGKSKTPLKSHAGLGEKTPPFPSGRAAPAKVADASSPALDEEIVFAVDFSKDTLEGWQNIKGGEPPGEIVDGWYRLGAAQGARTADSLSVQPGDKFRVEWTARAVHSTEIPPSGYAVGPIFIDDKKHIIQWWPVQAPPSDTKPQKCMVDVVAPEGACALAVGAHGPVKAQASGSVDFASIKVIRGV